MSKSLKPVTERHIRIPYKLLQSCAWRALPNAGKALFVAMRTNLTSFNNGEISATLADLKHYGWRSPTTLATAIYQLQGLGFIRKTRAGGVRQGSKICSLYAFTDQDTFAKPRLYLEAQKATSDYLNFAGLNEAKRAVKEGVLERRCHAIQKRLTHRLPAEMTIQ
jgi:hypothetical protein